MTRTPVMARPVTPAQQVVAWDRYVQTFLRRIRRGTAGGAPVGFREFCDAEIPAGWPVPPRTDPAVGAIHRLAERRVTAIRRAYDDALAALGEDITSRVVSLTDVLVATDGWALKDVIFPEIGLVFPVAPEIHRVLACYGYVRDAAESDLATTGYSRYLQIPDASGERHEAYAFVHADPVGLQGYITLYGVTFPPRRHRVAPVAVGGPTITVATKGDGMLEVARKGALSKVGVEAVLRALDQVAYDLMATRHPAAR